MSSTIFDRTDSELIISSLRGEIGDIIETWTLYRDLEITCKFLKSGDLTTDSKNQELIKTQVLKKKLKDYIISALSELAEKKYGQITFAFACDKLNSYKKECNDYQQFINEYNFKSHRNQFVSHKSLPDTFENFVGEYRIIFNNFKSHCQSYYTNKKIDSDFIGSGYNLLWHATRQHRYDYTISGKVKHILLPYKNIKP